MAMSEFEIDLLRAMYKFGILEDRLDQIDYLFDACDIEGGKDGRISFTEIISAVDNTGVFSRSRQEANYDEDAVTLDDLVHALEKIDIVKDRHLDRVEFLLLALDRSLIFSQDNLEKLFDSWDTRQTGQVSLRNHLCPMLTSPDQHEEDDALKTLRFKEMIRDLRIMRDPFKSDLVDKLRFFYICRDIFGVNTLEIQESLSEWVSDRDKDEEQHGVEEAPAGYLIESPAREQQVQMSDIRETTGEYNEDEEYDDNYQGHNYIEDM